MNDLITNDRLQFVRGEWRRSRYTQLRDVETFPVFQSDQEPGLVCWPSLWREPNARMKMKFVDVQGDPCDWPPKYAYGTKHPLSLHKSKIRYCSSGDGGRQWQLCDWVEDPDPYWTVNSDTHSIRTLMMADGSLLRVVHRTQPQITTWHQPLLYQEQLELTGQFPFIEGGPESAYQVHPKFFAVERSTDGGRHWETVFQRTPQALGGTELAKLRHDPTFLLNYGWFASGTRVLEDGAVAWIGRVIEDGRACLAVGESRDGGRTWGNPVILLRDQGVFNRVVITEEADFVPLGQQRYLVIARTDAPGNSLQLVIHRRAPGQWEVEQAGYSPLPHSGFPFLLQCADGTIIHQGLDGHWSTADNGANWEFHKTMPCYYGQMLETEPGRVFAVTQVNAGDEAYPHRFDSFLQGCLFSHRQREQVHQDNPKAEVACALSEPDFDACHVSAQIRVQGCAGLVARADTNASSLYALVIEHGSSPNRLGSTPDEGVFFSLCRMDASGRHYLARRRYDRPVKPTQFIAAQLVLEKGNLMAAIRAGGERPMYVSCHDQTISRGRCGVFADLSKASFRQFRASSDVRRIRDAWDPEEA